MKKQDYIIIAVLVALMLAWPLVYSRFFRPPAPTAVAALSVTNPPLLAATSPTPVAVEAAVTPLGAPAATIPSAEPVVEPSGPAKPEQRIAISNTEVIITLSSRGGGIISAECPNYRRALAKDSGPVVLDFSNRPAMTYRGLAGLSAGDDFELTRDTSGAAARLEKTTATGLKFVRMMTLDTHYQLTIQDVISNTTAQVVDLPETDIQIGPMTMGATAAKAMGLDHLGIDALASTGGEGVTYWAGKLSKLFKEEMKARQLPALPFSISKKENKPVDWAAVKSKFFVQILALDGGAGGYRLQAERAQTEGEATNPALAPKSAVITNVSAALILPERSIAPGTAVTQTFRYYVGPKKFDLLKQLGLHQDDVMDFGWWSPVCKFLLWALNLTYQFIPNYGVAILILTVVIQILFWPLTHKSTESMKKMQELQPLMTAIREKYKDNPRKQQEETMALYRQHKVNPVSGCLPMLIQIPVFIALFVVLRSAIELRFASFLWIHDLSEPENMFANILPLPLNILPIIMAVTMYGQQKLTPTTSMQPGQQALMNILMPGMMLVMFYSMPSALVLYWSFSQCITIAKLLIQKKRTALKQMLNVK